MNTSITISKLSTLLVALCLATSLHGMEERAGKRKRAQTSKTKDQEKKQSALDKKRAGAKPAPAASKPNKHSLAYILNPIVGPLSSVNSPQPRTTHSIAHPPAASGQGQTVPSDSETEEDPVNPHQEQPDHTLLLYETLFGACLNGHPKAVTSLVNYGVPVNISNENGETPLHIAISRIQPSTVKLLLDCGANPDAPDVNGRTPLHYAAYKKNVPVIRLLLARGANPNAEDFLGKTPKDYFQQ